MWQHFRSEAVHFLREKFTGFIRVLLADVPNFENWYDDLVAQQLLATTSGDRGRASFLSKKKTKVLRYALPQTFLEQFFHRHAARAAGAAVPEVRHSIAVEDLKVAASILGFLDNQRPHFQTLTGQWYVSGPVNSPAQPPPMAAAPTFAAAPSSDSFAVTFPEVALVAAENIPQLVATDPAAFVTAAAGLLAPKKTVVPLKEIQSSWRQLPEDRARRVASMQNAALSTLTIFQALVVTENSRGPKITKVCRFPLSAHLNAAPTATAPAFTTTDACVLLANAATPQPPVQMQWPTGANVSKDLSAANVPDSSLTHSDTKVAAARSLLRELRLVFNDKPPREAPWNEDSAAEPQSKRQRPDAAPVVQRLPLMPVAAGMPPPLPPPAESPH